MLQGKSMRPWKLLPFILFSSCNLVNQLDNIEMHLQKTSEALEKNIRAVDESTDAIFYNERVVRAETSSIEENLDVLEKTTSILNANTENLSRVNEVIKRNFEVVSFGTETLKKNIQAVEASTSLVLLNQDTISRSTEAIKKNGELLDAFNKVLGNIPIPSFTHLAILIGALVLFPWLLLLIFIFRVDSRLKNIHQSLQNKK